MHTSWFNYDSQAHKLIQFRFWFIVFQVIWVYYNCNVHFFLLLFYAFSRRFYPKRLTVHSGYNFKFKLCVFPGNWTHNLLCCWCNALPLSHRNTVHLIFCILYRIFIQYFCRININHAHTYTHIFYHYIILANFVCFWKYIYRIKNSF